MQRNSFTEKQYEIRQSEENGRKKMPDTEMNIVFVTDDLFIKPTDIAMDSPISCNHDEQLHFYILTESASRNTKNSKHILNTIL